MRFDGYPTSPNTRRPFLAAFSCSFLFAFTLACATPSPPRWVEAGKEAERTSTASVFDPSPRTRNRIPRGIELAEFGPLQELLELEFSFYDEMRQAMIHVTGPYRVVAWSEAGVELVGQVDSSLDETDRLTIWIKGDQLWAHLSMLDSEYLTRVR